MNSITNLEARVKSLERVCGLQHQEMEKVEDALRHLQAAVVGLLVLAGADPKDFQQQPAQKAPLTTMN